MKEISLQYTCTSKLNLHTHILLIVALLLSYLLHVDSPEKTASYSLYVVGSNGVLTEHILQPQ
jgi:hypothetical protein